MVLSPRATSAFLRSESGRKWTRYSAVSVVGIAASQLLILVFSGYLNMPGAPANILATALSSIPAYYLNRAWVWGKRGKNHLTKEVIPFWAFAFAGLVISTLIVVVIVPHPAPPDAGWTYTARVMFANLAGFGILWVAKFFAFEKLLFGASTHAGSNAGPPTSRSDVAAVAVDNL